MIPNVCACSRGTILGPVFLLLVLSVSVTLLACGESHSFVQSSAVTTLPDATTPTGPDPTEYEPATTTTVSADPTTTTTEYTGPWMGEAEVEAAGLVLQYEFFEALRRGDAERIESLLVSDLGIDAATLCAQADQWARERGSEALWAGGVRPLLWTGERYAWDAPKNVPGELDTWIKEHPDIRLGAQATMGDDALWWFGLEQTGDGRWLVYPSVHTHALIGLETFRIDAILRANG